MQTPKGMGEFQEIRPSEIPWYPWGMVGCERYKSISTQLLHCADPPSSPHLPTPPRGTSPVVIPSCYPLPACPALPGPAGVSILALRALIWWRAIGMLCNYYGGGSIIESGQWWNNQYFSSSVLNFLTHTSGSFPGSASHVLLWQQISMPMPPVPRM